MINTRKKCTLSSKGIRVRLVVQFNLKNLLFVQLDLRRLQMTLAVLINKESLSFELGRVRLERELHKTNHKYLNAIQSTIIQGPSSERSHFHSQTLHFSLHYTTTSNYFYQTTEICTLRVQFD